MNPRTSAVQFMVALAGSSVILHLVLGWNAYQNEHGPVVSAAEYLVEWGRDTFENWQSEFVQLAVQFALLAALFERLGVKVYEKDVEDIKDSLRDITYQIEGLYAKVGVEPPEPREPING